jgi:glycosyltransferase involved in cell wall biosynthesis
MKILVLSHEFPFIGGGGGRAAQDICVQLARRGVDVTVLTAHMRDMPRIEEKDGIRVIRIPSLRSQPYVASFSAMFSYILAGLWFGFLWIRRNKPDVIHAHFAVPAGALAYALQVLTGVPYVLTTHLGDVPGGVPEKTDRWFRWIKPFTPIIWKNASRIVAVSEYTRQLALAHYRVEIDVIPNGVDLSQIPPVNIRVNRPVNLVFAGRFVPQKNPLAIVRILAKMRDLDWRCTMLGDGILFDEVKREIREDGLEDRFNLPGWVTPEMVLERFAQSDILFMPSLSEGLPVTGVQGLANGLAIVASNIGGFLDLVEHGRNGFLIDGQNPASFEEALRRLMSDDELLERFRRESLEASGRFKIENIADGYLAIFKNIIRTHVLVINSEYPPVGGGAGNASENIAHCLVALGYKVTVLTVNFINLPYKDTSGVVTVFRIPALRRRHDRSGPIEQLAFILSSVAFLPFLMRRLRPHTTLAFFGMPSGAVALIIKFFYRIPYIVSLRGGDVPGFRPYDFRTYHKMIGPFLRVIWHNAAAVIANSRGLRDLAIAFDSHRDIPIIFNGVDYIRFKIEVRAWSPPRILSAGRVVYQKGFDLGLRALAQLKDLDWKWSIAGDGPKLEELKSLARELGISERVEFLGWQSREELVKWYQRSNIFLFPSRHEGMPNAVLEAMASGLPVVATRIAGNEELVLDGVTGLLVNPEDVDMLRDALYGLLLKEEIRKQMGGASRQRVEREFTWDFTARRYSEYLEQAGGRVAAKQGIEVAGQFEK